jgi:hypothetical protein
LKWLKDTANCRIHGTTKEVPFERLTEEQSSCSLPLPYSGDVKLARRRCERSHHACLVLSAASSTSSFCLSASFGGFMNLQHQRLQELCESLRLISVAHGYSDVSQEAAQNQISYTDFLEKILTTEIRERQSRSQTMLTKLAGFPAFKTLMTLTTLLQVHQRSVIEELKSLSL